MIMILTFLPLHSYDMAHRFHPKSLEKVYLLLPFDHLLKMLFKEWNVDSLSRLVDTRLGMRSVSLEPSLTYFTLCNEACINKIELSSL